MGRLFLVEFEQPNDDCFICKSCKTHIALAEDFHGFLLETGLYGGVFHKAVNVQVDEPVHHQQVGAHTVANIYCVKCGDELGLKYIQVGAREMFIQKEMVKLIMSKLLRRHGNEILDGDTLLATVL